VEKTGNIHDPLSLDELLDIIIKVPGAQRAADSIPVGVVQ
jgi:hypothetical protein